MADSFEDNFAEEDDGDLDRIIEQPEEFEHATDLNQEEDKNDDDEVKTVVKAKKRIVRPQLKLDAARLFGPRGVGVLESTFSDIKFKGKGHELEDLNKTMRTLEHWAHRLFPKMSFDDCIDKMEDLGSKKNVVVRVNKIRLGMEEEVEPVPDTVDGLPEDEPDPFDQLLSDVPRQAPTQLTEEQRARILRNRLIAEEIRMKKMQERQEALKKQAEQSSIQMSESQESLSGLSLP